jgi:hypothetical protein
MGEMDTVEWLGRLGMAVVALFNSAMLCLLALGAVKVLEFMTIGGRDVLIFGSFQARSVFQALPWLVIAFFTHCAIVATRQVLSEKTGKQPSARR